MSVRVQDQSTKAIPLQRSVRQGDVISPKLFTAALEDAFKLLQWKGFDININGEYITHLRFADDIVFLAESLEDLSTMLEDLNRVSQQVEENYANSVLLKDLYSDKEAMEREEIEKMNRDTQYGKELQQQIAGRQQQREFDYEDKMIENEMYAEVRRTMADEDQREYVKKREGQEIMRLDMVACLQERADWKEDHKQMIINEERRIEEQGTTVADRSAATIVERERKIQANDAHNQIVGAHILVEDAARLGKDNLNDLHRAQEYSEKNTRDDIAAKDKSDRVRKDMMDSLTEQMETKIRDVQTQKDIDVEYRKEAIARNAVEDAKDCVTALETKEKGHQYSLALRKQIAGNAVRRADEHEQEEIRDDKVWNYDRFWRQTATEERKKTDSEHGVHAEPLEHDDMPAHQ